MGHVEERRVGNQRFTGLKDGSTDLVFSSLHFTKSRFRVKGKSAQFESAAAMVPTAITYCGKNICLLTLEPCDQIRQTSASIRH